MKFKRIGVLYGGVSREREVSLAGGNAVADALEKGGFDVVRIDVSHELDRQIRNAGIEAAFIVLHGRHGEDGTVQGLLEMMQIPYTGSGVLASALAIDKARTRQILSDAGVLVARGAVFTSENRDALPDGLQFPVVVKPAEEGSSVGVSIAKSPADFSDALKEAFKCSRRILVEEYVSGIEVQVAVLDNQVLGAVEVEPHNEFYDYAAKYEPGGSTHHIPPRLATPRIEKICAEGKKVFDAVGCAGAARVDFILTPDDQIYCLEINTIPGMTGESIIPKQAEVCGISQADLYSMVIEDLF